MEARYRTDEGWMPEFLILEGGVQRIPTRKAAAER